MKKDILDLSFETLSNNTQSEKLEKCYSFWKKGWERTFQTNKVQNPPPLADIFSRQAEFGVFGNNVDLAGLHLYSFWNLTQSYHREHTFLKPYLETGCIEKIQDMGVQKMMSLEYLLVGSEWLTAETSVPLFIVMTGVGMKYGFFKGVDALVATIRSDLHIHQVAHKFGAQTLFGGYDLHNTPCELLVLKKEDFCDYPDPRIMKMVDYFYQQGIPKKTIAA